MVGVVSSMTKVTVETLSFGMALPARSIAWSVR